MTVKWLPSYAPVDEEFGNVSLLLHGDGTNGSTTIIDSSSNVQSVTVVGDAQISTAQSKFGGSSIAFDGSGDYLRAGPDSNLALGSGDFTVEAFIYVTSLSSVSIIASSRVLNVEGSLYWNFAVSVTGQLVFQSRTLTGTQYFAMSATSAITTNTWYHVAAVRQSNVLTVYVNGVAGPTTVNDGGNNLSEDYVGVCVFNFPNFVGYGSGYIDDLRITKGVARYTSNFTPPTAPFPDLSPSGRITIEDNSLDVDARQYIINVEEQDGQSLESGVRTAINDFVVGCKSDGIWNAIKASCILAGARTLDGALVPLVGGAPTNFNFVSGDYDRETGLVSDGSSPGTGSGIGSKYLNTNRKGDADPRDSSHLSVFVSTAASNNASSGRAYIGVGGNDTGAKNIISTNSTLISTRVNNAAVADNGNNLATGFIGASRADGSNYLSRITGVNYSNSIASQTGQNLDIYLFRLNWSVVSLHSNARLAFYSIGESLDLAKLDARVTDLINAIGVAIP